MSLWAEAITHVILAEIVWTYYGQLYTRTRSPVFSLVPGDVVCYIVEADRSIVPLHRMIRWHSSAIPYTFMHRRNSPHHL